jgi:hypothetical protein
MAAYPFNQARNYTPVGNRQIDLIVVHDNGVRYNTGDGATPLPVPRRRDQALQEVLHSATSRRLSPLEVHERWATVLLQVLRRGQTPGMAGGQPREDPRLRPQAQPEAEQRSPDRGATPHPAAGAPDATVRNQPRGIRRSACQATWPMRHLPATCRRRLRAPAPRGSRPRYGSSARSLVHKLQHRPRIFRRFTGPFAGRPCLSGGR